MEESCWICKWFRFNPSSDKYPMNLFPDGLMLCDWKLKNERPKMPPYLYKQISTALCYPYHLEKDEGRYCPVFEAAQQSVQRTGQVCDCKKDYGTNIVTGLCCRCSLPRR